MKKLLLLALLGLTLSVAKAQSGFMFNGFTSYPSSSTYTGTLIKQSALLIDNAGNKWIGFNTQVGTSNVGLLKYDNATWTNYTTLSTPALPSNNISALTKDNAGNIWIGTRGGGLVKYDGINFTTYNTGNGLASNTVTCIDVVGSQIYVGTNAGLSRFDGTTFTNYNVASGTLPSNLITAIKAESPTIIWIGYANDLVKFNINSSFTTTSFASNTITPICGNINCIYIDASNAKWLGTTTVGVLKYTGSTFVNANTLYEIYGSSIPPAVYDISEGLNNGVAFKMKNSTGFPVITTYGTIELASNGKVYQYFAVGTPFEMGDYIEKSGTKLYITQKNNASFATVNPTIYYTLDKTLYTHPLGTVNNTNFKTLDINNVKAGIANRGDMHWDIDGTQNVMYEVPKGSGKNSNSASGLWIGGIDNSGQLHGAAQTYRQGGVDFWPGPLDLVTANTNSTVATNYDKIWKVSYTDINDFITNFNNGNVQNGSYIPTEDILTWPANGNIAQNYSSNLAPYVDVDGDNAYNPLTSGDYPKIKGDQALFYVYNDKLAAHGNTSCTPIGIEVQAMAYAYGCPSTLAGKPELAYTTFYDYKIINRSSNSYHDVYVSMWSDADIGYFGDDYIGCNVANNYGYAYNAQPNDAAYGSYPPAQGIAIMKGPLASTTDGLDNNNNGMFDEPNEENGMSKFTYFNNSLPGVPLQTTDPQNCGEYYNYMTGFWRDNTPFTCGGNAYGGTTPTSWAYPGDPNTGVSSATNSSCGSVNWIETGAAGDRRFIISSGPFDFLPGEIQEVEYAFVTSFDSTSTTNANLLSVAKLKTDVQKVKNFYNLTNKPTCLQSIVIGVTEVLKAKDFNLYPNPSKSVININSTIEGAVKIEYEVIDVLGKVVLKNESRSSNFTVNIDNINAGIYFIRLSINNNVVVKKIVKE